MKGKMTEMKGRVKKAAGELAGNDRLKFEGDKDKVVGKAKQAKEIIERKKDEFFHDDEEL